MCGGVMDWQDYDYIVASRPNVCVFSDLSDEIEDRMIIAPRYHWIAINDADAIFLKMSGLVGLVATPTDQLYIYKGSRFMLDLAVKHHPSIDCWWIDQFEIAFANDEAKLRLDSDLGDRVLRAKLIVRPTV